MKYCSYKQINSASLLYKGFTLMEMLISMTVISILMAASLPMLTQFSTAKTGVDRNVIKCITNNNSTGWYDTDGAGATILPTTEPCRAAVSDTQYSRGKAFNTSDWFAKNGTATQQSMARKILRAACDLGGEKACDYFINYCRTNGVCDDTASYEDIAYYLHLNRVTYANNGATYIINQLTGLLPKMINNLLNATINASSSNPNSGNNIAFELAKPWVYILACNAGISDGCNYAYSHNYNKSCYQIRSVWATAPTQTYNLKYNTGIVPIYCNMSSYPSAAISGCNLITTELLSNRPYDDCSYGWTNSYNRTCNLVASFWPQAPADTYNLTWNGAPPTALVPTSCPIATPACVAQGQGSVCADGTVYAGDYDGHHYYTTPADQGIFSWGTDPSNTLTNVNDVNNGRNNTNILTALTNPPDDYAPYKAAGICQSATDYGYNDWYLPARYELGVLSSNRADLMNFAAGYYWTSTEADANNSRYYDFNNGSNYTTEKWNTYYVRCIRQKSAIDTTCPNIGDTCSDGTKYAGPFSTYYLFTTPLDKGQYTWNNGNTNWTYTNANDINYGMNNHNILVALTNPPDDYAPYNAALACQHLNNITQNGYTDWYLPAYNELVSVLYTNRVAIGGFAAASYWSSTEYNNILTRYYSWSGWDGRGMKNVNNRVRCIRRDP